MLSSAKRPLFWLGHGIRLADAVPLIAPFLDRFQIPFITSWQGKDMVDNAHPLFYGHAGVYGHRAANNIVQRADLIIAIGTRLALPQTGYDLKRFAPNAHLIVVDVDADESSKLSRGMAIQRDAGVFMRDFMNLEPPCIASKEWLDECESQRIAHPWLEPGLHDDAKGYINSYHFMWELNKWLKPDQIITTDMGTALLCAYPMLRLNGTQRLITSTGLGEMGFGLPAAVGAAIATGQEVLCLNCDGGMMFNLQELATVQHHRLPIKILIFDNGGYNMIRRSQEGLGMKDVASGGNDLSFPSWSSIAAAFSMEWRLILNWRNFNEVIPWMQSHDGPCIVQVMMDPNQKFGPKVPTLKDENGNVYSPGLEVMV